MGDKIRKLKSAIKNFIIGATVYDLLQTVRKRREYIEYLFMMTIFGDLLGYPVSSYYKLRFLPIYFSKLDLWKKNLLRERDITEKVG